MSERKFSSRDVQRIFYESFLASVLEKHEHTGQFVFDNTSVTMLVTDMLSDSSRFRLELDGVHICPDNVSAENVDFIKYVQFIRREIKSEFHAEIKTELNAVVNNIVTKSSFVSMIGKVKEFYLSCTQNNIDEKEIRETFYNIMVDQVVLHEFISKEDLLDQESYIYLGMSALVVIESISQSKNIDGIRLNNGSIVTKNNCPEMFKDFYESIIPIKESVLQMNLSDDQIKALKFLSLQDPSLELIDDLKIHSKTLMPLVTQIVRISTAISQIAHFKDIINSVIKFCIDVYG